ncbi:hypothetical protein [Stutzerimonas nitrititolerans]|uniref:hypothetical protein n=1 Tax=Stutzerimonas nitrititolerans TaxID=2482751 RepID=UPI0028A888B6|nr:hypothetical protein [Stutzerimonas nitrititolerans]
MEKVVSILTLLCAIAAFYLQYHSSGPEAQQRLNTAIRSVLGSAGRVVTYCVVLLILIMSLAAIYLFWTSTDPIRRPEVVMLILHIVNAFLYGYMSFALPFRAFQRRRSQASPSSDAVEP